MRDYWLTQYLLAAVGWAYIIATLIAIALALWLPKGRKAKAAVTAVVIGLASILPIQGFQQYSKEQQAAEIYKARLAKAQALFAERCKTAGEKIYRTVEGVEGVMLLNVRDADVAGNRANPLWPDAALPNEAGGDQYIRNFLYWEHDSPGNSRGVLNAQPKGATAGTRGYRFVDVKHSDSSVVRYRLEQPGKSELVSQPITGQPARYAVRFVNQVDSEDREHWVAGTTITITDTKTGEILAQRNSYSFESGLGDTSGFRSPWGFAVTCPSWKGWDGARTRFFVDQILKPAQGE